MGVIVIRERSIYPCVKHEIDQPNIMTFIKGSIHPAQPTMNEA